MIKNTKLLIDCVVTGRK